QELAQVAAKTPALKRQLEAGDIRTLWEQGGLAAFSEFAACFGKFIDDHGHREMDMDYYHPTSSLPPTILLTPPPPLLTTGKTDDPAASVRLLRQCYLQPEPQFLGAVPDEVWFFFHELIRLARTYTTLHDLEHYQPTPINPVARRAVLTMGERLRERGVL